MLPQSQPPARLAFGPFEVDVGARQLLKGGIRLRLSSQPFRILLILLAHPGCVVTSEQLRQEIWGDGTVLFARDAPFNLFRKDANGVGTERRLTQSPDPQFPMDWSTDGRFILYEQDNAAGDRRSLWVLPMGAGTQPRPYLRTPFNEDMGRFSSDGRWIAFQSDDSGRNEKFSLFSPVLQG